MRTRIEQPTLKTWEEVNQTLKKIAEAQNEIAILESGMNIQIDAIKDAFTEKVKPYQEEIKKQEILVKEFVTENRTDLKGKSRKMTFGTVGFRASTKLSLPKSLEKVIAALRKKGMEDCIVIKETVNKDILKTYETADILAVGGKLKQEDTFWYDTEKAAVNEVS